MAGKENLFEVAARRSLNLGSPDFFDYHQLALPQKIERLTAIDEGSYQAPRTGIELRAGTINREIRGLSSFVPLRLKGSLEIDTGHSGIRPARYIVS